MDISGEPIELRDRDTAVPFWTLLPIFVAAISFFPNFPEFVLVYKYKFTYEVRSHDVDEWASMLRSQIGIVLLGNDTCVAYNFLPTKSVPNGNIPVVLIKIPPD